jgi:hypothetical protein
MGGYNDWKMMLTGHLYQSCMYKEYYGKVVCINMVVQLMFEKHGENWWDEKVSPEIKKNVDANIKREEDSGYTQRSELRIDYTTFGELSQIVTSNWEAFSNLFRNTRAFKK